MAQVLLALLLDASLAGAIAGILSLTSREFGLLNLAAGGWVVLGGWIGALVVSHAGDVDMPVRVSALMLFLPVLIAQVAAPYILRRRIVVASTAYLFVSLGCAVLVSHIGQELFLESSSASIPLGRSFASTTAFLIAVLTALVSVTLLFRSGRWARLVIAFRSGQDSSSSRSGLSKLIAVEIFLLMLIGLFSYPIHLGLFGSAELRTIVSILALAAVRYRPIPATALAFCLVLLTHILTVFVPSISGFPLAQYSGPAAIIVLAGYLVARAWPPVAAIAAQELRRPPQPLRASAIWQDAETRQALLGTAVLSISVPFLLFLAVRFPTIWTLDEVLSCLRLAALAGVAWIARRHLGSESIAWPIVGASFVYISSLSTSPLIGTIIAAGLLLLWSQYFWALRVLRHQSSFVLDISFVVAAHAFIKGTPLLSRSEEVLAFQGARIGTGPLGSALLCLMVLMLIIATATTIRLVPTLRAISLAISNFPLGLANGLPVRGLFRIATIVALFLAVFISFVFYRGIGFISVNSLNVETGILVLLLAFLYERAGIAAGLAIVIVVFGFLVGLFSGQGTIVGLIIGSSLVCSSLFVRSEI